MILLITPLFSESKIMSIAESHVQNIITSRLKVLDGVVTKSATNGDGIYIRGDGIGFIAFHPKDTSAYIDYIVSSILADRYINVGICGSLTPGIASGSVFEATKVVDANTFDAIQITRSGIYDGVCSVLTSDVFVDPVKKSEFINALNCGAGENYVADMMLYRLKLAIPNIESIKIIGDTT